MSPISFNDTYKSVDHLLKLIVGLCTVLILLASCIVILLNDLFELMNEVNAERT